MFYKYYKKFFEMLGFIMYPEGYEVGNLIIVPPKNQQEPAGDLLFMKNGYTLKITGDGFTIRSGYGGNIMNVELTPFEMKINGKKVVTE